MPATRPTRWQAAIPVPVGDAVELHHVEVHAPVQGDRCWAARVVMRDRWDKPFDQSICGETPSQARRLGMLLVRLIYARLVVGSGKARRIRWRPG